MMFLLCQRLSILKTARFASGLMHNLGRGLSESAFKKWIEEFKQLDRLIF